MTDPLEGPGLFGGFCFESKLIYSKTFLNIHYQNIETSGLFNPQKVMTYFILRMYISGTYF